MVKKSILIASSIAIAVGATLFVYEKKGFWGKNIVEISQNQENDPGKVSELEKQESASERVEVSQVPQDAPELKAEPQNSPELKEKEPVLKSSPKEDESPVEKKSTSASSAGKITDKLISWGFQQSSGREMDTIVIHSSYDALGSDPYSVDGIIAEYKQYEVSAHYLISRDGEIFRLVADKNIAWHAGVSKMPDGRTNVNAFSLGIEMVNKEDGKYAEAQYTALNSLLKSLKEKYEIKYVLGHDDIAPGRKTDPWGIEWGKVVK